MGPLPCLLAEFDYSREGLKGGGMRSSLFLRIAQFVNMKCRNFVMERWVFTLTPYCQTGKEVVVDCKQS